MILHSVQHSYPHQLSVHALIQESNVYCTRYADADQHQFLQDVTKMGNGK